MDRVGEPALLAHLLHQPRAEAAAAQDVVGDLGRVIVRVVPVDAGMAEHDDALRRPAADHHRVAAERGSTGGSSALVALAGSPPKVAVEERRQLRGRDVAGDADLELVAGEALARRSRCRSSLADGRQLCGVPRVGPAIGMASERRRRTRRRTPGSRDRVSRRLRSACIWLRTRSTGSASKRGSVSASRSSSKAWSRVVLSVLQIAREAVAVGIEREPDRVVLERRRGRPWLS